MKSVDLQVNCAHSADPLNNLKAERCRFVNRVIWSMIAIAGAHFIVFLASGALRTPWDVSGYPVFVALLIAALRMLAKGMLRAAAVFVSATVYASMVAVVVAWGDVEPGVATSFIVLVLVAGFSMGSRAGAVAAVLSTVTLGILILIESLSVLPSALVERTPATETAMVAMSLFQAGVLIWYGLRRLEAAVTVSALKEKEARGALTELGATREDNERRAAQGDALARLAERLLRVGNPDTLRRETVEAVGHTLGLSAAALIHVGDTIEVEHAMGLRLSPQPTSSHPALAELSRSLTPTVIDGADSVRGLLDPLFVDAVISRLVIAPVRMRSAADLLIAGSSRELTTAEVEFVGTVANLLGGIRERQAVEGELRQAQKMEVVGQVSGSVAHDFNNLLFAILGSADLLKLDAVGRNIGLIDNIIRAGEHASMLTRQLLAFARRKPESVEMHDLKDVVQGLSKLLDRLTGERVRLSVDLCDEPVPVAVDRGNVEQVLFNLVANARDAVSGNGEVRISLSTDKNAAMLCVCDDGVGMPPEVVKRIFEPFFTTKPEGRGTGIGLATVRRIIDDAGGAIEVDTAPGQGTTFRIRLPLALGEAEQKLRRDTDVPGSIFPATIVLLDDNAMVREATRAMLEKAGHRVLEGQSGKQGEALIGEGKEIDLVLSDVIMPEMGGVELMDLLRVKNIDVPVILMTGYADPDLDLDAVARASDVLRKPVRHADLIRKINAALEAKSFRR